MRISKSRRIGLSVLALALVSPVAWALRRTVLPQENKQNANINLVSSQRVTMHATARGKPWINLTDGREVPTAYSGPEELRQVLERNQAQALSLASADYDEDGVPDLISGYASSSSGIVILRRGNIDAIYPNASEAKHRRVEGGFTDSPFLPLARAFNVPEAAELIGTGDFDGDGHFDVVTAARGSNRLYLLCGDGRGVLQTAKPIELSSMVTALITGEINRLDGLDDVVVGTVAADGPKVLVFEGPNAALRAEPETFSLPAEAKSMALGQLDDDGFFDLAIAAGSELLIVHGRDRTLSLDVSKRAEAAEAKIDRRVLPFVIRSLAVGDFAGDRMQDVALLSEDGVVHVLSDAKVGDTKQNARSKRLGAWDSEVMTQGPWREAVELVKVRVSNQTKDDLVLVESENHGLHILTGSGAIVSAENAAPMAASEGDRVTTSLDVEGEPVALLPMRLNTDATSDLVLLIAGQSAPTVALTLVGMTFTVTNTNDSDAGSLRQAIIDANLNPGADAIAFSIPGPGPHTITPTTPLPQITDTVTLDGTTEPDFADTPIIELNGASAGVANGLAITGIGTVVRGLVINRFSGSGIQFRESQQDLVEGNFIGTDVTGTASLGNLDGVRCSIDAGPVAIGGTVPEARNIISGNGGRGISAAGLAGPVTVQGNFIGTDITGTADLGNGDGIVKISALGNIVGNVISGNEGNGVQISDVGGLLISGNFIGTDVNGATALANSGDGVLVSGSESGPAIVGNVISGNSGDGVDGPSLVQGNFIGTDISSTRALGNSGDGVKTRGSSRSTLVGNVISGNGGNGVFVTGVAHIFQGNYIGTDKTGSYALGNGGDGIHIIDLDQDVQRNTIAFNNGAGVSLIGIGSGRILSNSIFSNGGLGIDLANDGVTLNDACDGDSGPDGFQNFPALGSVSVSNSGTTIQGSLNSTADSSFTLEFFSNSVCDPSGFGEGERFIGSTIVTTDSSCNAGFTVTLPGVVPPGEFITATATDAQNDTSEFSKCIIVACTITCPANIEVPNEPGQCGAHVTFAATTSGTCGPVTYKDQNGNVVHSGDFFPVGATTITASTTAGPSCSFTVKVKDTEKPAVTLAATRPRHSDGDEKKITFSATDNCPGVTVSAVINIGCKKVPVSNNQIVDLECDRKKCKSKIDHGDLEIEAKSAVLEVTAKDTAGNARAKTLTLMDCKKKK